MLSSITCYFEGEITGRYRHISYNLAYCMLWPQVAKKIVLMDNNMKYSYDSFCIQKIILFIYFQLVCTWFECVGTIAIHESETVRRASIREENTDLQRVIVIRDCEDNKCCIRSSLFCEKCNVMNTQDDISVTLL